MTNAGVISTNHTSFTVSDLDRSIAFFSDVLGFTATPKLPRSKSVIQSITGVSESDVMIAYLHGPGHTLELIEYLAPPDRSEDADCGQEREELVACGLILETEEFHAREARGVLARRD